MSFKIASSRIRDAVLKGVPESGPPSLKSKWARSRYRSPLGLNAAFDEALEIVNTESKQLQEQATKAEDPVKKERLEALSQRHNPEVRFNNLVQSEQIDPKQPVYKMLAQRKWQQKKMLMLMQRLEQHHVIPDTLPTLDPQADIDVRFITPTMRDLEPGEFVANDVCSRLPQLQIRDYGVPAGESAKYTVVIMTPDRPDLPEDRFDNHVKFIASNVTASLDKPAVNFNASGVSVSCPYEAPFPEKNAPAQRQCVWVFRQSAEEVSVPSITSHTSRYHFNIREFARKYKLTPVGASFWRSKWDITSPAVREKYGMNPGEVYYRARTAKPEDALLHVSERPKWMKVDGLE